MNKLIKTPSRLCLFAAIIGAAFLANSMPSLAQGPAGRKAGAKPAGPTSAAEDAQLNAIHARANAIAAKMDLKDPKSVKQVNAELAKIHTELVGYAKEHGLKLTTKTYEHPAGTNAPLQSCQQKEGCELLSAIVDKNGVLHCVYSCVATGAAVLANPVSSLAQEPEAKRSPPITVPTRPPTPPRSGELNSIQARARAAAAKLDFKDPKAVKQVNAELSKVHADLVAYAKANGLKLTTRTYKHPVGTSAAQTCPEKEDCTLVGASVTDKGVLNCIYTCTKIISIPPTTNKQ
jgi:hypothetical protein